MSLTPYQVLAELPLPVQIGVFGGEIPQMDIGGMRLLAEGWRTLGNALENSGDRLTGLAAALPLEGRTGIAVTDVLQQDVDRLSDSHRLCQVMADRCDHAADESEKALWSMAILGLVTTQQVMVAMGTGGIWGVLPVLQSARKRFLLMLEAFIARLAEGAAARAAWRTGLALTGYAALPAGVDLAVQQAQIVSGNREHLDWRSVGVAFAAGSGSTVAGFVGGRMAALSGNGAVTGARRAAVVLSESGAGVLGGVLAVAPLVGFPSSWEEIGTAIASGAAIGLASARVGAGTHPESHLGFGPSGEGVLGLDAVRAVSEGKGAGPGAGERLEVDGTIAEDIEPPGGSNPEPDPEAGYRLTDTELRRLFEEEVVPAIFGGVRSVAGDKSPEAIVVVAQTGAGKSTLIRQLHAEFADGDGLAHLTVNQMFRFHPRYAELVAGGGADPVGPIVPEAKAFFQMALDHAVGNRFNVAVEETFKSPPRVAETVARFARAGHAVSVDVLAVSPSVSRLSMIRRFVLGEDEYMPAAVHDRSYADGMELVEHLGSGSDVSRLRIRTRSEVVFDGPLDSPSSAGRILEDLRDRPWTSVEKQDFLDVVKDTRELIAKSGRDERLDIATVDKMLREVDEVLLATAPQLPRRMSTVAETGGPLFRSQERTGRSDSDSGPAARGEPARPRVSARARVLLLNDEWHPGQGGVTVLNRNLAEGFAAGGHEVFVRVGHDVTGAEGGDSITVLGPRHYAPDVDRREQMTTDLDTLPDGVDVIIAHSRHTGYAGRLIRALRYPDATLVHLAHTDNHAFGNVSGKSEVGVANEFKESALISTADVVVGTGPILTRYVADMADRVHAEPLVHELVPGLIFGEQISPPEPGGPYNLLVFGRANDERKGIADAAEMVRQLNERGIDVGLTVRGAKPETISRAELLLSEQAGRSVSVLPYTLDPGDILADLRRTHLVLMPSRAESFGMVATESLAVGVPVLVPDTSGVGRFLADPARFPPELTADLLVPQGYASRVPIGEWVDRIEHRLQNQETVWRRAGQIRQELIDAQVTWQSAAESLLQTARRAK